MTLNNLKNENVRLTSDCTFDLVISYKNDTTDLITFNTLLDGSVVYDNIPKKYLRMNIKEIKCLGSRLVIFIEEK